jgi:molybdopterin synthase sulfur carrier subunit
MLRKGLHIADLMAVKVHLSGHLKAHTNGELEVVIPGNHSSVKRVLQALWKLHPALRDRVLNDKGEIRQHVNVFSDGCDVKRGQGLSTKLIGGDIHIFNAVSGG